MIIKSRDNGKYKYINSLKQKKNRVKDKRFILEGKKVIEESIEFKVITEVALSQSFSQSEKNRELIERLESILYTFTLNIEAILERITLSL